MSHIKEKFETAFNKNFNAVVDHACQELEAAEVKEIAISTVCSGASSESSGGARSSSKPHLTMEKIKFPHFKGEPEEYPEWQKK